MTEEKITKNIITKETIAKELLIKNTKDIRTAGIISGIWGVIVLIIFSTIYSLVFINNEVSVFGWIVYLFSLLLCIGIWLLFTATIPVTISQNKKLKAGNFSVLTDEVLYKQERTVVRHRKYITEKIFHFQKFGDIRIYSNTYYQITSQNDKFYLVVYDPNSKIPQTYYPAKMYEYKE